MLTRLTVVIIFNIYKYQTIFHPLEANMLYANYTSIKIKLWIKWPRKGKNTGQAMWQRTLAHFQIHFLFFSVIHLDYISWLPLKFGMIEFELKCHAYAWESQFLMYESSYSFNLCQLDTDMHSDVGNLALTTIWEDITSVPHI